MVPESIISEEVLESDKNITKTYFLDFENKCIKGNIEGKKAMEQAIQKILNTKRYAFEIYDWNYGSQINELIGTNMITAEMLIEGYIEDALLADDRIEKIENFTMEKDMNKMSVKFEAVTKAGVISVETEADI